MGQVAREFMCICLFSMALSLGEEKLEAHWQYYIGNIQLNLLYSLRFSVE